MPFPAAGLETAAPRNRILTRDGQDRLRTAPMEWAATRISSLPPAVPAQQPVRLLPDPRHRSQAQRGLSLGGAESSTRWLGTWNVRTCDVSAQSARSRDRAL
jgi:hypothetical protein